MAFVPSGCRLSFSITLAVGRIDNSILLDSMLTSALKSHIDRNPHLTASADGCGSRPNSCGGSLKQLVGDNMRKTALSPIGNCSGAPGHDWLDLDQAARVEVSSEAEGYPVEGALLKDVRGGWRASEPGSQTIRLLFDHPQTIRVIRLVFKEREFARTQEFVLRWLPQGTRDWKDVVRQQWNFSPPVAEDESEEYKVNLPSATGLELSIRPDISGGETRASLESLKLSVRPET